MTVVFECFVVYLVEVNCSCPPVVGEIYHLTCFPLWGVYLPSRLVFIQCICVWLDDTSINTKIDLTLLNLFFSKYYFHFLNFPFSSLFLFPVLPWLLSFPLSSPSPIPLHWQLKSTLSPCSDSHFPSTLKCAYVPEIRVSALEAACQELHPGSTTHQCCDFRQVT